MAAIATRELVRTEMVRLVHRGLGRDGFPTAVADALGAEPSPSTVCASSSVDPATHLPTGEVVENGFPAEAMVRLTQIELQEPDFNKFVALAHGPQPAASLSEVTEGELDQSLRQRELRRPSGFHDEFRVVLSGATGAWGALTLLREANRPYFTSADVRFVASLAEPLADGLRRAALIGTPPPTTTTTATTETTPASSCSPATTASRWPTAPPSVGSTSSEPARSGRPLPAAVRAVARPSAKRLPDGATGGPWPAACAHVRRAMGRRPGSLLGAAAPAPAPVAIVSRRPSPPSWHR